MLYEILDFSEGQFPAGLGWHDKIMEGFPQSSLWSLARTLAVEPTALAELVGLPVDEVSWKRRGTLLPSQVSDKLFRLARAYQRLFVPLKDESQVQTWLRTSQVTLGNQIPVILLMTQCGSEDVMRVIDAIKPVKSVEMNPVYEDSASEDADENRDGPSEDEPAEIA